MSLNLYQIIYSRLPSKAYWIGIGVHVYNQFPSYIQKYVVQEWGCLQPQSLHGLSVAFHGPQYERARRVVQDILWVSLSDEELTTNPFIRPCLFSSWAQAGSAVPMIPIAIVETLTMTCISIAADDAI